MSFNIINKDITDLPVDAIVNAANTSLKMGRGVCGAIFRKAGVGKLQEECNKLAPIKTGQAIITKAYNLKAKYIIHTAGPIYDPYDPNQSEKLLRNSYINSLNIAIEYNIKSIAFPLISAGIYGYPYKEAIKISKECIIKFLDTNYIDVYLAILDKNMFNLAVNS